MALKKKQEKEKILAGEGEGGRGGGLPPKWVMQKLEAIEAALQSMDRDRDKSSPVPAPSAAQTYQDPQDVMLVPNSDSKLSVIAETDLNPVEKSRLKYGREIVAILGMADSCKLEIARALPGKGKNDGKKRNNAFRNSYWFDASTRNVYVHVDRVNGGGGDLTLVLIHALSHLKVDGGVEGEGGVGDGEGTFISEVHRNYRIVTNELINRSMGGGGGGSGSGSGSRRGGSGGRSASTRSVSQVGVNAESDEYFNSDALADRMKKYAVGVGETFMEKWKSGKGEGEGEGGGGESGKGGESGTGEEVVGKLDLSDDDEDENE